MNGPTTLTPEVMFIEKKRKRKRNALTLAGLVGKCRGRGTWEFHVALISLQSMKWMVQGMGPPVRWPNCPLSDDSSG